MPHDVDVKALMRLAIVYDVAIALNRKTAGMLLAVLPNMDPDADQGEAHG